MSKINWISAVRERIPEDDQLLIYYFKYVGMHLGKFKRIESDPEIHGEGNTWLMNCFYSESGFLCDEDVYWAPIGDVVGMKEWPDPPGIKEVT